MTRFSNIILTATALVASIGGTAPAFAAHASDGYHWEYTPGPRGMARRVADKPANPIQMADSRGHWRLGFGPRSSPTWVPASADHAAMSVDRMAGMKSMSNDALKAANCSAEDCAANANNHAAMTNGA